MADRSIKLVLSANVTGLVSGLKTAQQALQDTAKRSSDFVSRNEQSISHLSNVLGGMGLALTAGFGYAVKTFADFDAAMSSVAAATMTTGAELDSLRQAAIDAGAATSFSATEAAGAIENLAKAGISTADILNGGLTGALDLAAAGELDVASAAEIAATAMTQFGLSGEDVTHIADLLAAGAGKAQGDVTDLAGALKQSGLVASQFGLSIEETTGTLAAFASAGLLGSDAGTSLRTMLLRLGNPSKEAAEAMADLGISAYDAQGNFIGMSSLAGQLEKALAPLPQAQRDAAMATIFGSDAIRAANVLYKQGAEGIQGWIGAVDDQGYAAEQAAMRLDNLKGDLEALSGSFESLILQSGSGANEWLRSMVQGAEGVVDAFSQIPAPVLNATTLLVGGGGLVALGIAGLAKLTIGINNAKAAVTAMGVSMKTAGLAAGALGGAIGVAAIGLTIWAQNAATAKARTEEYQATLDNLGNSTDATMEKINNALSADQNNWLDNLFGKDADSLIDRAERAGVAIEDLQGYILGNKDAIERVTEASRAYVSEQENFNTNTERNSAAARFLTDALDAESGALTDAEKAALQKAEADEAAGVSQEDLAGTYEDTTTAVQNQTTALASLLEAQAEAAGVVLSEREAQRNLEEAYTGVTESIEAQIQELAAHYEAQGLGSEAARKRAEEEVNAANKFDITTEAGRRNQAALDDIATSTWDVIKAMQRNGADQKTLQGVMQTSRDRFLGVATAAGMSADEANALADELGLIPSQVQTDIIADTGPAMANIENFKAAMASIQDRRVQITTAFVETGIRPPAGFYAPSGARASGGGVTAGRTYLVGENGPEMFTAPSNGMVSSHGATMARAQPGVYTQAPSVNVNVPKSEGRVTTNNVSIATNLPVTERTIAYAMRRADRLNV